MSGLGIGSYPPEYNARVHGPYDPGRFYGKPDVAFKDVKLGELGPWMSRRSYNPLSQVRGVSRFYWRWSQRWMMVRKPTAAPIIQLALGASLFFYLNLYSFLRYHRHTKYHW